MLRFLILLLFLLHIVTTTTTLGVSPDYKVAVFTALKDLPTPIIYLSQEVQHGARVRRAKHRWLKRFRIWRRPKARRPKRPGKPTPPPPPIPKHHRNVPVDIKNFEDY